MTLFWYALLAIAAIWSTAMVIRAFGRSNAYRDDGIDTLGGMVRRWFDRQSGGPQSSKPEPEKPQCYGHPRPPTVALRESLPKPPDGHAWETKVTSDANGTYWLHLALINIVRGETVAARWGNLTRRGIYGTWADCYRKYPRIAESSFNEDLIGPLTDWAATEVAKMAGPNTFDYKLG
ncbi:hypothetical protein A5656_28450 [Mycobacterium gordonae]|nr:hypothetical protein [Mycobacterium gordonae]OBK49418.1 hypothetical protein A5656_28450 [Mycobacterium gordonae]